MRLPNNEPRRNGGFRWARRLLAASIVTISLVQGHSSAGAHTGYDGSPHGEGKFSMHLRFDLDRMSATSDDTKEDGHCVYWNVVYSGVAHTESYSCGAPDTATYTPNQYVTASFCVTGHWDCGPLWVDGFL